MNKIKNSKKGFTLLELLIVVLIIGILAAIALPQYKMAVLKSKYATIKNKTVTLHEAKQRYYLLHNRYATTYRDLDIDFPNYNCNVNSTYVVCDLDDDQNHTLLQYIIMTDGRRRCDAFPADTTSLTNKICQMETKKNTPYNCAANFCIYYY